jgi:hypothetical protein
MEAIHVPAAIWLSRAYGTTVVMGIKDRAVIAGILQLRFISEPGLVGNGKVCLSRWRRQEECP